MGAGRNQKRLFGFDIGSQRDVGRSGFLKILNCLFSILFILYSLYSPGLQNNKEI